MRYRTKPERKPDPFPVEIDASDIEAIAATLGDDVTVTITTEDAEYDGVEDLVQNLHRRTKFEAVRFTVTPAKGQPYWTEIRDHMVMADWTPAGRAAEEKLLKLLIRHARNRNSHRAAFVMYLVAVFLFGSLPNVAYHHGKGDLSAASFVPSLWAALSFLPTFLIWRKLGFWLSSRLIPRRREPSFMTRNRNAIVLGALMAVLGAVIGAVAHALGAK